MDHTSHLWNDKEETARQEIIREPPDEEIEIDQVEGGGGGGCGPIISY